MNAARTRWLKRGAQILAIAGVVTAVLAVRVVTASRSELEEGNRLRARGDVDGAIVHFRRAARWYAPASPFPPEALDALAAIADEAERAGERDRALASHRAIRAAILSTRSFYTPFPDRLDRANRRIAELMSSMDPPPIDAGKSREQLRREHLALLEATDRPKLFWTLVLLFGFAAWVSGAFVFVTRAIDEDDRLVAREARRWGTVIVVGFGLFVLGMALA